MKKYDFILIIACIACFIVLPVTLRLSNAMTGSGSSLKVNIYSMGVLYGSYPLNTDADIHVEGRHGFNDISICDGCVKVYDSDCSNQLCVDSRAISESGDSIACLPHALFVVISASDDNFQIDGVTY